MRAKPSYGLLSGLLALGCSSTPTGEVGSSVALGHSAPTAEMHQVGTISVPASIDVVPVPPSSAEPQVEQVERVVRGPTSYRGEVHQPGAARAKAAIANKAAVVQGLFDEAGVTFPPAQLMLRVFKEEAELEVWASSNPGGTMIQVATYGICRLSGGPGPKRREGDQQVPEGFYQIQYFWPDSAFYLAAKVDYPNALDVQLGKPRPGGDIMIHGGCASIGCIAISDERIEELWTIGRSVMDGGRQVFVHIFPGRDIDKFIADPSLTQHREFWENLREGHLLFERTRVLPRTVVGWRGRYEFFSEP